MTSEPTNIDYSKKCLILADFWLNYKDEEEFDDFVEYNDIGLPLAFMITENIVESTQVGEIYVNEAWELLCAALNVDSKQNYDTLEDMFLDAGAQED
jgi:DNA modification methylase